MRILLISHEASRTGAPRIAELSARSLIAAGHDVSILSRAPGPLLEDFRASAPTSIEIFHRVRRKLWSFGRAFAPIAFAVDTALAALTLIHRRPDLVYVNSTSAAIYLRPARWLRRRRLLHVHESGTLSAHFLDGVQARSELETATLVACSPSVQTDLAELSGRPLAEVPLVPSVPNGAEVLRRGAEVPDHAYPTTEIVVGCCGTVEHRKGADLWVEAARAIRSRRPELPLRFVWVGEIADPVPTSADEPIEFIGGTSNPYAHMCRFDIATLPSRDDPFPLVVLEAMTLGTPVVAFGVGGVPQQIGAAGVVVPPGDVGAFADALVELATDDSRRRELGERARARVVELYSTQAYGAALRAVLPTCSP